jgi:signal transduction histidine kinase
MNSEHPSSRKYSFAQSFNLSIKLRLVILFLLLAASMTAVFVGSAQKAFSFGWRAAAQPLLTDYIDHLMQTVAPDNSTPNLEAAMNLTKRLPVKLEISGPIINWASHPNQEAPKWNRDPVNEDLDLERILSRSTNDGHTVVFGVDQSVFERRPRLIIMSVVALLVLTLLAWWYVNRQMAPLDEIREVAKRFGLGQFDRTIQIKHVNKLDELGQLAVTVNTMGKDIQQMLVAKDDLLLAISHELRSPLTRAKINVELLPDGNNINSQREALRRDLLVMAKLIDDLLESERLSAKNTNLIRTTINLAVIVESVVNEEMDTQRATTNVKPPIRVRVCDQLPLVQLDETRIKLLLRNLISNAIRHGHNERLIPELIVNKLAPDKLQIEVRDYGPGIPENQIHQIGQAFYRPEAARSRNTGGVGLGLYLCKLVALAHGGSFEISNADPGISVKVTLPLVVTNI